MSKFCENCENIVNETFEFCPFCSSPLTEKAKKLENDKAINAQLVILASLIREIDDPKALYAIDNLIKKLSTK